MDDKFLEQMKLIYDVMGDPKLVEAIASMSWNLFVALKNKGFTDDQAIQIVGRYSASIDGK